MKSSRPILFTLLFCIEIISGFAGSCVCEATDRRVPQQTSNSSAASLPATAQIGIVNESTRSFSAGPPRMALGNADLIVPTLPQQLQMEDLEVDVQLSRPNPSWIRRFATFLNCFDCSKDECKSGIDFCFNKKWLKPTPARVGGVLSAAAIYAATGIAFWQLGPDTYSDIFRSLAAFVLMNGAETALNVVALFNSIPPSVPHTSLEKLRKLAVIIPIYGRDKDIQPTLDSLLRVNIALDQIFVIENTGGRYPLEQSKTYQLLNQNTLYSFIHYRTIQQWGNKAAAELLGTAVAKSLGFEYMMVTDDDVTVHPEFDPYLDLIQGDVRMIAFPIKPSNNINLLTRMQKREYHRADRHNYFKATLGTVFAPHGAISISDIDTYLQNMRHPPVDGAFYGEDQKKGAAWRWTGSKIKMAPGREVATEVPGNLATFYGQRVGSWDTGTHLLTGVYVRDCLTDCPTTCAPESLINGMIRKFYQLQALFSNYSDIVRPTLAMAFAYQGGYWWIAPVIWEVNNLVDIADDVYFRPHRKGKPVLVPQKVWASCLDNHLGVWYSLLQAINGTWGACCGWVGAGAASDEDYGIKRKYPQAIQRILDIPNPLERNQALAAYAEEIGADPRRSRRLFVRPPRPASRFEDLAHDAQEATPDWESFVVPEPIPLQGSSEPYLLPSQPEPEAVLD